MIRHQITKISLLKKSILINCSIMTLWWLAFNPGFFSGDSFAVINMARNRQLNSLWTAPWAIFIDKITIGGRHPEFGTLIIALLLGASVAIFANSVINGKLAIWIGAILTSTPTVGAMGITLWHDIPMTAGFLLVVSAITHVNKSRKYAYLLVSVGLILGSFRHNGLPAILIFLLILLAITNYRKFLLNSILMSLLLIFCTVGLNQNLASSKSSGNSAYLGWMRNDISCYLSQNSDPDFLIKTYGTAVNIESWKSASACKWFSDATNSSDYSPQLESKVPRAWFLLFKDDPYFIISTHLKRHAYLIPIPIYGIPNIPFIHTTIELKNQDIQFTYPAVTENLRYYPRLWNFFKFFFGYAGFWLSLTFLIAWKRKSGYYFQIGILGLIESLGFFIFADIPDGRYMLFSLIAGQFILFYEMIEPGKRLLQKSIGSSP